VLTEVLIGNKIVNLDSRVTALTTSAQVQLFPDPNTGIRITDGANDVFKCITGGVDVGDVILGSAIGQCVKWDKSAGKLIVNGELAAGILTGAELKATANLTVGTSNNVIRVSGDDATYRLWVGHPTAASAPFRVTQAGVMTAVGAHIHSAESGARVSIFPDANTGLLALASDGSTEVFRVNVGGTDVGDVIQGNYSGGAGSKWDQSAGTFTVAGALKTTTATARIEASGDTIAVYNSDFQMMNLDGSNGIWVRNSGSPQSRIDITSSDFRVWYNYGASAVLVASLANSSNNGRLLLKNSSGNITVDADRNGIDLENGGTYKVSGNQVVGARGAAVADATDAASVILRLNDLLARCRAHGLIAS
jgi:hypothetical protein